jgi:hypothetical protein
MLTATSAAAAASHQIWKGAVGAEGVGVVAEIVDDLEQALLAGGGP